MRLISLRCSSDLSPAVAAKKKKRLHCRHFSISFPLASLELLAGLLFSGCYAGASSASRDW